MCNWSFSEPATDTLFTNEISLDYVHTQRSEQTLWDEIIITHAPLGLRKASVCILDGYFYAVACLFKNELRTAPSTIILNILLAFR